MLADYFFAYPLILVPSTIRVRVGDTVIIFFILFLDNARIAIIFNVGA